MYKFITIAVGIYIIYYVWRAYSNMKNLKKNMDDNPKELLISYDNQIDELRKQLAEVNETIARNQGFPPSFSVNRLLKKAKKQQDKLLERITQKEAARSNYLKLLRSYQEGKIDKAALKKWVNDNQRR
ncbi:hypothetical protein AEL93_08110 [Lactobacillus crispatus]|jgi:hypothetical protein|uniref:hypothetical protein n=2 Tax=Lactobacillus crispatus TaxID=47770 RepID=UPI0007614D1C|nr:hypothetical protein [Lactobacillus crispatus]KWU06864.1 hypothetical protein AEL96_01325 [Lactobacillus crispatus]KWX57973.1 hypothetical protein AEL93_08110 [Lactobacillus crispatus]MCZ3562012.1 hypothetical protein [Lactobacillus crispatus]MCZ3566255.1 hypothetical protein [Lactobacillus crispatus]MCZ3568426.1 hypothetical protein [Lactobacillus crispatus]